MNAIIDLNLLISVIIPVYKTEKYLARCLDSVINQTYKKLEIIIVDDGSPDESYIIAERYCKIDKRIRLIRQCNMGLSGARNTGIETSKGKYLVFLDSDDSLAFDGIEKLVYSAIKNGSDVVIPDRYIKVNEDTGKQKLVYHFSEEWMITDPAKFALLVLIGKGRAWRATSVLYEHDIIRNNKLSFPVGYTAEDITFNLSYLSFASKLSFCQSPTLINLKRKDSITASYDERQLELFLFIDKQVNSFLVSNKLDDSLGQSLRDSLLCRNTVIVLTTIMSAGSSFSKAKFKKANSVLRIERIFNSFNSGRIEPPYFNSNIVKVYFSIVYFLVSKHLYLASLLLIWFAGKYSGKN